MKAGGLKPTIIFVFLLTLGAGIAAGLLASKLPSFQKPIAPNTNSTSWLVQELDLNPQQSEQIRQIWEGVNQTTIQSANEATAARDKRDADIQRLIPNEKIDAYRTACQAYDSTVATLKAKRQQQFDLAVKRTKDLLNPAQQTKYNIILKQRLESGDGGHQDSAEKTHGPEATPQPSPS